MTLLEQRPHLLESDQVESQPGTQPSPPWTDSLSVLEGRSCPMGLKFLPVQCVVGATACLFSLPGCPCRLQSWGGLG